MLDKILVFISMAALIAFLGVVVGFVREPDLIIVTTLIVALAAHDFWITVFKRRNGPELRTGAPLESLPTGVSGKPASRKKSPAKKKTGRKKPAKGKK
ncbi:MAG TPA: hypothetical protein ENH05_00985 [Rhizobiales bacterium]|nr:hypothetical protein BMS3Bbin10_02351 [bacterium BMS3Bbin10]HDO51295.1 hypothetical protein [Hyphomicrobiales bacterium]